MFNRCQHPLTNLLRINKIEFIPYLNRLKNQSQFIIEPASTSEDRVGKLKLEYYGGNDDGGHNEHGDALADVFVTCNFSVQKPYDECKHKDFVAVYRSDEKDQKNILILLAIQKLYFVLLQKI